MSKRKPYPAWICSDCGDKWGRRECGIATWHTNTCCICGERRAVTEPRDYGHLKDGWEKAWLIATSAPDQSRILANWERRSGYLGVKYDVRRT